MAKSSVSTPWGVGRPWSSTNSWFHHPLTLLGLRTGLFSWTNVRCLGQSVSKVEYHEPAYLLLVILPSRVNSVPRPHGAISHLSFLPLSQLLISSSHTGFLFLPQIVKLVPTSVPFHLLFPQLRKHFPLIITWLVLLNLISAQMASARRGHFLTTLT